MRSISESELRKALVTVLDQMKEAREPVIITRDGGKAAAVPISLEEFASFEETVHLLRSPANAKRLEESIAEFEAGGGTEHKLTE